MDKAYDPKSAEEKIYKMWENGGYFTPRIDEKKNPFSILLPLPNANDPMHMGHALFAVQDILIRYHRMLGDVTLWLPGGDHAGIETQYVFEKKLAKEGKSRFDYDRNTLYTMISDFVDENRNINKDQMKRLGFSLDWTRYRYSMDPGIVQTVLSTFKKLHDDNLVYRAERMVNFCTKCGTAFSDLEVNHQDQDDTLYYLDYGPIQIATVRPETIFADVAVAVNPKDKRYKKLVGRTAVIPLLDKGIPIISDPQIDIAFGAGALKVTPAHDKLDYEIGKKNNLPVIKILNRFGRLENVPAEFIGQKVLPARKLAVEQLSAAGKIVKTESYTHSVSVCYRCKTTIEPMLLPQWFVKTKPLAQPAIEAVKKGKTKIFPLKRFEKMYFDWMNNIEDWNISRQIVWGPRIPVWYRIDDNPDMEVVFLDKTGTRRVGNLKMILETDGGRQYTVAEIEKGLQQLIIPEPSKYVLSDTKPGDRYLQDTDTFDTWFLSGQWPLTTLGYPDSPDFKYFYPTSLLDTMWDILFFWVARMMMLGIYRTCDVPFKAVHLHSRVVDGKGQKMSKSKGNVINPIEMVDKYGADALRFALIFGAAPGSDIALSEDKVRGMRNFANKLWNIGRFITLMLENANSPTPFPFFDDGDTGKLQLETDRNIVAEVNNLTGQVTAGLGKYRFSDAAQKLYEFSWHRLADVYIEENKQRYQAGDIQAISVLLHVYQRLLKLLHPFMPFVTEEIWDKLPRKKPSPLIVSSWPVK